MTHAEVMGGDTCMCLGYETTCYVTVPQYMYALFYTSAELVSPHSPGTLPAQGPKSSL